jgi:tetratricopeptide (TPR) repeat protein
MRGSFFSMGHWERGSGAQRKWSGPIPFLRTIYSAWKVGLPALRSGMNSALPVILALLTATAAAQQSAEAFLIDAAGGSERVWITSATHDKVRYQKQEQGGEAVEAPIAASASIYLLEPAALSEAIDLFQARQYAAAKVKFAAIKTAYHSLRSLPDNPATIAGFLEMECLRKSGDLAGLAKAVEAFDKSGLTRRNQLRQLDLYALWDAVRLKDWPRVNEVATARLKERLPGGQRAQAAWCLGVAHESQGNPREAIDAYQVALTADGGASEDLARDAALRVMRLHQKDPEVKAAMKQWGTPAKDAQSTGHRRLAEAAAIADLFELTLGGGTPLPAEQKELLKFRAKR